MEIPTGITELCGFCERGNCKCGTEQCRFRVSSNLRIPPTKNKVKFRKFLEDCSIFTNCVPEELRPMFLDLLRKVKYYDRSLNGHSWTKITS